MSDFEDSDLRDRTPEKTKRSRNEGSKSNKQTHKKQKFRSEWMDHQDFKDWLAPVIGEPLRAKCKICEIELTAELTVLKKHKISQKHKLYARSIKHVKTPINNYFDSKNIKIQEKINRAEMLLCGFIAEHNLSLNSIDHLSKLCQEAFSDSDIGRTKATAITKNVIGKCYHEDLAGKLMKYKFSVIIDESTDVGTVKNMAIYVKYYNLENDKLETKFWELVQLSMDPESAKKGFAADGCNTMFGEHNSVSEKLKEQFPGIFLQKCICHSLHLVASAACRTLPRDCEDLVRDVFNYFKASCRRISQFKEFRNICELEPHKMLRPAQTRWLSLGMAVSRITEQWEALKKYFAKNHKDDRLKMAENIYHRLHDPSLFMYYTFLNYILPKITSLNKLFQSDKPVINSVYTQMSELYKDIIFSFIKKTPNSFTVDPKDETQYLPLNSIYSGASINITQNKNINEQMLVDVLRRCRFFLIELCIEIKLRFDFNDQVLSSLYYISPKHINSILILG
ncbi:hypothetical protein ACI65C_004972 [Semiaphis heraclei]